MFSKRRFILFLIVLGVMLLVKYAVSQQVAQGQVGWDFAEVGGSSQDDIYLFAFGVVGAGTVCGLLRAWDRHFRFAHGQAFDPGITRIRLS